MVARPLRIVLTLLAVLPARVRADGAVDACVQDHKLVQSKRHSGGYLEARDAAFRCARSECPQLIREDCAAWYLNVQESLPSLVFEVRGARGADLLEAQIRANGELLPGAAEGRAITVDPGRYRLRVEAPGHQPLERDLIVHEGAKNRRVSLVLQVSTSAQDVAGERALSPLERARPASAGRERSGLMPAALALAAVATAGLSASAALGMSGWRALRELDRSECKPNCSRTEVDQINRSYVAADVAAAVGAAAAIAGTVVYVLGRRARVRQAWRAGASARGVGFAVQRVF